MFNLMMVIPMIYSKILEAMKDKELTIKEIYEIVDTTLRSLTGKGLDQIGVSIKKVNGKTKIELIL